MDLTAARAGRFNLKSIKLIVTFLLLCLSCILTPFLCFDMSSPPEIVQSQRALYQVMAADNLAQTDFFDDYPDATPSDFVAFWQSDAARVLEPPPTDHRWPEKDAYPLRDSDTNWHYRPRAVDFVPLEYDPHRGAQLVFLPNDDNSRMFVECYEADSKRPVKTLDWAFPTSGAEANLASARETTEP